MNLCNTFEKIQDWLVLPKPEYCDKHGHKVSGWWEAPDHVEHGVCDHCGQEMYKPEPHEHH